MTYQSSDFTPLIAHDIIPVQEDRFKFKDFLLYGLNACRRSPLPDPDPKDKILKECILACKDVYQNKDILVELDKL